MLELLQELWDVYVELLDGIDDIIECHEDYSEVIRKFNSLILDTPEMWKLRARLTKAGVKIES